MRYSSVNHWYKIEEVLGGLDGTSSASVQTELLRHLSSSHIQSFEQNGAHLKVRLGVGAPIVWNFASEEAVGRFVEAICEWFESQKVAVPAH